MRQYHAFYSDLAAEFIISLPKRKQRKVLNICDRLPSNPFIKADYSLRDADGRDIEHMLVEGFIIAYWVDHAVCKVMVVELTQ